MRVRLQNCQIKRRKLLGPAQHRGEDDVYGFLLNILEQERRMQTFMGKKSRHWWRLKICSKHICKESLVKDVVWDNFSVHHPNSGQSAAKAQKMLLRSPPKNWNHGTTKRKKRKTKIDQWIAKTKETCLLCAEPLLVKKPQRLRKLQPEKFAWTNKGWVRCITVACRAWARTLVWKRREWSLSSWEMRDQRGMRGGISMISKPYVKASNLLVEGYTHVQYCQIDSIRRNNILFVVDRKIAFH